MQNRFVGDVGDFAKHGLLRYLSGESANDCLDRLRLGIIWYLSHDPKEHNGDGRYIDYLRRTARDDKSEYIDCDSVLWEKLRDLVFADARCVHCAEEAELLPTGTLYYSPLFYFPRDMKSATRRVARAEWFAGAHRKMKDAELVCVDPDNGLIPKSVGLHSEKGPKYTCIADLKILWEDKKNLVIYQQCVMDKKGPGMVKAKKAELRQGLELDRDPIALWFSRGTARVFFVIPQPCHEELIEGRVRRMLGSEWGRHFVRVGVSNV